MTGFESCLTASFRDCFLGISHLAVQGTSRRGHTVGTAHAQRSQVKVRPVARRHFATAPDVCSVGTAWAGSVGSVDEHLRYLREERTEERVHVGGQRRFVERVRHERAPALARRTVDRERRVTQTEPRVTTLLDVTLGSAESSDQEIAKPLLGTGQVGGWIHRAENVVIGNLPIERRNQAVESTLADRLVDVLVVHDTDGSK